MDSGQLSSPATENLEIFQISGEAKNGHLGRLQHCQDLKIHS
ncbi:hypothetical protein COLO4_35921 [Corchorus olitorius]|uniref:Uncharacterized protein n=1 Tax=Corchorus olitorius TaxID=93759 RepID=A0A1R3GBU4_9ROSI|nr:hypothetical protein COLO4_35921 [Corchorus olitorius]